LKFGEKQVEPQSQTGCKKSQKNEEKIANYWRIGKKIKKGKTIEETHVNFVNWG